MLTLPPCEGRKRIIHTHENVYHTILLWVGEIYQISNSTKTSVNKRLICLLVFFRVIMNGTYPARFPGCEALQRQRYNNKNDIRKRYAVFSVGIGLFLYLFYKFSNGYYIDLWPRDVFQRIEMFVIGYNKLCIGSYRAINKLVIIHIGRQQLKMYVCILHYRCWQIGNSINYITGNICRTFLCQNLFVFLQNICINAQTNLPVQNMSPYLMIRTFGG